MGEKGAGCQNTSILLKKYRLPLNPFLQYHTMAPRYPSELTEEALIPIEEKVPSEQSKNSAHELGMLILTVSPMKNNQMVVAVFH